MTGVHKFGLMTFLRRSLLFYPAKVTSLLKDLGVELAMELDCGANRVHLFLGPTLEMYH